MILTLLFLTIGTMLKRLFESLHLGHLIKEYQQPLPLNSLQPTAYTSAPSAWRQSYRQLTMNY